MSSPLRSASARHHRRPGFDQLETRALLTDGPFFPPMGIPGSPGDGTLDFTFLSDGYSDLALYHADAQVYRDCFLSLEPFKSRADQIRFHVVDTSTPLIRLNTGGGYSSIEEATIRQTVTASGQTTDFAIVLHDGRSTQIYINGYANILAMCVVKDLPPDSFTWRTAQELAAVVGRMNPWGRGPMDGSDWRDQVAPDEYFVAGASAANWNQPHKATSYHNILNGDGDEAFDSVTQRAFRAAIDHWAGPSSDLQAPTVAIAGLHDGDSVAGVVPVALNAIDDRAVTVAQLYVDGRLARTSWQAPFTLYWKTGSEKIGTHTLVVKATDAAGNVGTSAPVQVNLTSGADITFVGITPATDYAKFQATKTIDVLYWPGEVDDVALIFDGIYLGSISPDNRFRCSITFCEMPLGRSGPHTLTAIGQSYVSDAGSSIPGTAGGVFEHVIRQASVRLVNKRGYYRFDFKSLPDGSTVRGLAHFSIINSQKPGTYAGVTYYLDGRKIATARTQPFSITWDSRKVSNGPHTLTAISFKYRDFPNQGYDRIERTILVQNLPDTRPPSVKLTSPRDRLTVRKGPFTVTGLASDNAAVAEVDLFLDGRLVSVSRSRRFAFSRKASSLARGEHTLQVRAVDAAGNVGWSRSVTLIRV